MTDLEPPRPPRILIALDFEPPSDRALAWAFAWARRAPCELHVVHVVDSLGSSGDARARLDAVAPPPALAAAIGPIERHLVAGDPTTAIVELAQRLGAAAIVTGTHARTGVLRFTIESVAAHVVRHATCPVLCVPLDDTPIELDGAPLAPGGRILCAIDFSDAARRAGEVAIAIARALHLEVVLLHVVSPPTSPYPDPSFGSPPDAQELLDEAHELLATWTAGAGAPTDVHVEPLVALGQPAAEIVRLAHHRDCGLIIVGTHGRTGLSRLLLGSIAEKVIRTAHRPVLAVHPAAHAGTGVTRQVA